MCIILEEERGTESVSRNGARRELQGRAVGMFVVHTPLRIRCIHHEVCVVGKHVDRISELVVVGPEIDRTGLSNSCVGMEIVAVHIPVRPRPEVPKRGVRIWTLVERNSLLSFLVDVSEHVLVFVPRRPTDTADVFRITSIRMV